MIGHGERIPRSGIAAYLPPCISTLTNHRMKWNLSVILRNQRWRRTSTTPPLVTLHSHCAVRWNGFMGEWFAILCGVRQGGVLSPYLFSVQFMSMIWFLNSEILVQTPTLVNCLWDVCYMLMTLSWCRRLAVLPWTSKTCLCVFVHVAVRVRLPSPRALRRNAYTYQASSYDEVGFWFLLKFEQSITANSQHNTRQTTIRFKIRFKIRMASGHVAVSPVAIHEWQHTLNSYMYDTVWLKLKCIDLIYWF